VKGLVWWGSCVALLIVSIIVVKKNRKVPG
jgi:hypothetical protein